MESQLPYRYQYDATAANPTNLASWRIELKAINHLPNIAPYGLFYADTLTIVRSSDGQEMVRGVDYEVRGWEKWVSDTSEGDAYAAIDFIDKSSAMAYEVTGQVVGGVEGTPVSFINEIKKAIEEATLRPSLDFNLHVKNKPHFYNPGPHKHVLQDMEDLYLLSQKFDDVFNALVTRVPMQESGMHYQEQIDRLIGLVGRLYNRLNLVSAETGSSNLDRIDQVLELVANYVSTADESVTVQPNSTTTLDSFVVTDISGIRGSIVLDTGTHVEMMDFMIASGPSIVPRIQTMGFVNTAGDRYLSLDVSASGSSVLLTCHSSRGGEIKVKYYSVL